jgi:hypothetical protein
VQPKRSGAILTGPEAEGGTPQRFVWLNAGDSQPERDAPDAPEPLQWRRPHVRHNDGKETAYIEVCQSAIDFILDHREASLKGETPEDEAHLPLMRLKTAVALALLDGRTNVGEDDWALSELVMRVSASTREGCMKILGEVATQVTIAAGRAEAVREIESDKIIEEALAKEAAQMVVRALAKAGGQGSAREIRQAMRNRKCSKFTDLALERLIESGEVEIVPPPPGSGSRAKGGYQLTRGSRVAEPETVED